MKNIDTAFRYTKTVSFTVITGAVVICIFTVYKSETIASRAQNKIYILANGRALEAYGADRNENVPVEARDHIRQFHKLFFTIDPDEKVIRTNISMALYLADGSAKREYDNLRESGFYSDVIAANASQRITIDSILLDLGKNPHYFRCYATQEITRSSNLSVRSLITEGYLRSVSRSDNNPHGFLIERWQTLENKEILQRKR